MKNVEKDAELVPPVGVARTDTVVPLSLAEPTLGSLVVFCLMVSGGSRALRRMIKAWRCDKRTSGNSQSDVSEHEQTLPEWNGSYRSGNGTTQGHFVIESRQTQMWMKKVSSVQLSWISNGF